MFFTGYQMLALDTLWGNANKFFTSREVWEEVNGRLGDDSISRASIINFLESVAEKGLIGKEETTGKGGMRGLYKAEYSESEVKRRLVETVIKRLLGEFPEETNEVFSETF
jgi:predicted transcriptional regulator